MTTPASYSNPAKESRDLDEEKAEAYQKGHDSDLPATTAKDSVNVDVEKAIPSHADSTHSDERTLSEETAQQQSPLEETDPDIVDWDGPDDPYNPLNWSFGKKWTLMGLLAAVTLITPLGSSFFAPGVPQVMRTFGVTSNLLASFVVSVYVLGFAIGPLIIAPMSELYGRIKIYHVCNFLFIIFTVACALSTSMGMLVAFRLLAGCAGAAPLTIGGGTIADIFPVEQRAGAMAIFSLGPLLGPIVGPIAGGYLTEAKGWRWVFWVLTICSGFLSIMLFIFGRETYAPTLLEKKAARLRKETGNQNLKSKLSVGIPPKEVFARAIVRPLKMLFFSPIVLLMALYTAFNYGILYILFTTITFVFQGQYNFSTGSVGLSFIGMGVGMLLGMGILGFSSDKVIKQKQAKGNVKPEHRLPIMLTIPGGICLPIGIFMYGWSTEKGVHWIVPIIGTAFVAIGNLAAMMTIQTYLVDAFALHAASAIAANTVLRSIFGGVFPLFALNLYDALGLGWGNSLLAFVSIAMIPVPVLFRYYGERIRTNPKFQVTW